MKLTRISAIWIAYLCLVGVALAQHVQTDYDHQANFSQYKTFSWEKVKSTDPLWDDRIKNAVDGALGGKGLSEQSEGGDIAIVAMQATHTQKQLQTFYDGFGGGWRWRGFGGGLGESTTTEQDYKEGTLIVDLYDAKTKQLIWRGSATDMLSDKAQKNEKNLQKGVAKMFKDFPPGEGKQ